VQDIAHVINYDLPEVAENFIHRVGRTGRAGERGVASTLFGRDQRSDLYQLERTLGIRMERMSSKGDQMETDTSQKPDGAQGGRSRIPSERLESAPRARMVRLPGEVLQVQMQN
jgi:ATP-dependent RNA helicase RhlE